MKLVFEDDNVVVYSKFVPESQDIEITTVDGEKRKLPIPSLFELGFGIGASLGFIKPDTGEFLCGWDGEIVVVSTNSNKVVYNNKIWSLKGLAIHLQSKYPQARCSDAITYDFFGCDSNTNLCERSLMDLYNDFFEKKYGIKIQRNRFSKILIKNREKNQKDTIMIDSLLEDKNSLTLASKHDWAYSKCCEWNLKNTKFSGNANSFKDMFKQVICALHAIKPDVLNGFIMEMVAENDLLFRPSTKEIFHLNDKQNTIINGSVHGIDISTRPFNSREIENYTNTMWIEIVPNWIYVWGLYSNNDMISQLKKVFDLYGIDYGDLAIKLPVRNDEVIIVRK